MNTPLPLLNIISGSQNAGASARTANQADSFTADVPFKQVLNTQVSSRNNETRQQDMPKNATQDAPKQPQQQAAAPAQESKPAATSEKKVDDKQDDQDQDDDATTSDASAQILALVASLTQNAVKPVDGNQGEQGEADLLAQGKKGLSKLLGQGDAQQTATDGRDKKIDFAALQGSIDANAKKEAAPDLGQTDANQRQAKPGDKSLADLGADKKAAPKEDASALTARAATAKAGADANLAANVKSDAQSANATPAFAPALQQAAAATNLAQNLVPVQGGKINPNVGSAGWDQAVGQKVTWMVSGGIQSASITLNPPDLGPMQVVLSVHNQQADATFITAQPEVKQALEAAMPKLREMMDQAGIQLGQATVNTGTPGQQQQAHGQQTSGNSNGRLANSGAAGEDDAAIAATATRPAVRSGTGMVDTFV